MTCQYTALMPDSAVPGAPEDPGLIIPLESSDDEQGGMPGPASSAEGPLRRAAQAAEAAGAPSQPSAGAPLMCASKCCAKTC